MKIYRVLEKYLGEELPNSGRKKMAAAKIKSLLLAVDFEAEVIPENRDMLTRLLISLKGGELTEDEKEIVREITS
jgi:hypothetical protein